LRRARNVASLSQREVYILPHAGAAGKLESYKMFTASPTWDAHSLAESYQHRPLDRRMRHVLDLPYRFMGECARDLG
jgi:hypothetical protein